jgi:hypothetical protein
VVNGSSQNSSKKPVFAHIRGLFPTLFGQNVDSRRFPRPLNIQTLNLRTVPRTSHLNARKMPAVPAFSPFSAVLTSTSHQNVDCFPSVLAIGNSLDIDAAPGLRSLVVHLRLQRETGGGGTLVIPVFAGLYLQKINFSVSATLKQPALQMNGLRQIFTETAKNTETLNLKNLAINLSNVLPLSAISAISFFLPLCDLCLSVALAKEGVFVFKGPSPSRPNSSKKPVFAHNRGLFSSPGESQNVDFCPSKSSCFRFSVTRFCPFQNVHSAPPLCPPFPCVQNPIQLASSHQNSQKCLEIPPIPSNPTFPSHKNVDSRIGALGFRKSTRFQNPIQPSSCL